MFSLNQPTQASQAIRGRKTARTRRDKSGWEHVQAAHNAAAASQDDQQASEREPEALRRGKRIRKPTQKVIEMQDNVPVEFIELSSDSESDSDDEEDASDVAEGVAEGEQNTVVTRKVLPKPPLKPRPKSLTRAQKDDMFLNALQSLQAQGATLEARLNAQYELQDFRDIDDYPKEVDEVDLTIDTAPKPRMKAAPKVAKTKVITAGMNRKAPSLKTAKEPAEKNGRKAQG
jgi:hypothetical protein